MLPQDLLNSLQHIHGLSFFIRKIYQPVDSMEVLQFSPNLVPQPGYYLSLEKSHKSSTEYGSKACIIAIYLGLYMSLADVRSIVLATAITSLHKNPSIL